MTLLSFLPGFRFHVPSGIYSFDDGPLLHPKTSSIELEYFHNSFASQHTLLQVAILLAVEILFTLWGKVVLHELRQMLQVTVKVARVVINYIVD